MFKRLIFMVFDLLKDIIKFLPRKRMITANLKRISSFKSIPRIKPDSNTFLTKNTNLGKNCNFNGLIVQGNG